MKFSLLMLAILLQESFVSAQLYNNSATVKLPTTIFLDEVFGKPFNPSANADISGSPFFSDHWKLCTIQLKDGRYFENVSARLNIFNQTVHYLSADQKELVAPQGLISTLLLLDTAKNGAVQAHLFHNDFKPIDNNDENTFYEIIAAGKAQLLLCKKVKIAEMQTLGSGVVERQYIPLQEFYINIGDIITKCKRSGSFFMGLFMDKREQVAQYIGQQHLKFKSVDDLKLVVEYYNSL